MPERLANAEVTVYGVILLRWHQGKAKGPFGRRSRGSGAGIPTQTTCIESITANDVEKRCWCGNASRLANRCLAGKLRHHLVSRDAAARWAHRR
jgi:hypothetical protein